MNKRLELRIIESGYNTTEPEKIELHRAGEIIRDELFGADNNTPGGMIFFDGFSQIIVRSGIAHSIIEKNAIALTQAHGNKGLFIYSFLDDMNKDRVSVFIDHKDEGYVVEVPVKKSDCALHVDIKIDDPNALITRIEFLMNENTDVQYFPHSDHETGYRIFWERIATQVGIDTPALAFKYDRSLNVQPYHVNDSQSRIDFMFATTDNYHSVKLRFSKEIPAEKMQRSIMDLDVNIEKVNSAYSCSFNQPVRDCEVHIQKGKGDQVIAYLANVLQIK